MAEGVFNQCLLFHGSNAASEEAFEGAGCMLKSCEHDCVSETITSGVQGSLR
jgi:hypothetical protein